jgi:hypothetical protein
MKINDSLIPTEGSPAQGASYEYVDKGVKNRQTYYYKLEDIDLSGKTTLHSPVSQYRMEQGISKKTEVINPSP